MSASRPANMRGPRVKTPLLLLLLLPLLVLFALTGTASCQDEGDDGGAEAEVEETDDSDLTDVDATSTVTPVSDEPPAPTDAPEDVSETGSGTEPYSVTPGGTDVSGTPTPEEGEEGLGLIVIAVLVGLVVVIIGVIVCGIFICRRWNSKKRSQELRKEDPYLDGSSTEKVPMPMFEEDVPSVLELEMEELDQWMIKDSEAAEEPSHP